MIKIKNNGIKILNISLFLCLTVITANILSYLSIQPDQIMDDFQPFFSFVDHGNYLISSIDRLVTYTIPAHLGIHILDWASSVVPWFRAFVIVLVSYLLSSFAFINLKKNILHPVIFAGCYLGVLFVLLVTGWQLKCAEGFGRFVISNIFMLIFWLRFAKLFITQSEPDKKMMITLCFLGLILGNVSELLAVSSAITLLLILAYNNISKRKVLSNKTIMMPLIFIFIGGMLMFFNPNYIECSNYHTGNISVISIIDGLKSYKAFLHIFLQKIILQHWTYYLLILVLGTISFFLPLDNNESRRTSLLSFFLTTGLLAFFLTFIASKGSVTHEIPDELFSYYYKSFWLVHHDFPVIIRLELLLVIMLTLFPIIKKVEKYNLLFFIASVVLVVVAFFIGDYKQNITHFKNETRDYRISLYKLDKIALYYYLNNKKIEIYYPEPWKEYFEIYPDYFKKVYNIKIKKEDITWLDSEKILYNFDQAGGLFTPEELAKLEFKKLRDKNFVLRKK